TVLGQGDFNTICRQTYNRPDAFAVRDGNRPQGAYNWSCYVIQVPTATPVPPVPPGASRVRLGAFQVEWYCNNRGLGVRLANEERDWACLNPNGDVSFVLGQADYDAICRQTYNNPGAYALRDGVRAQHAYNWSCYVLNFAPTPAPPFGTVPARLGGLDVTAYCAGRGLGASITATNTDWACLNADRSINFVLTKNDYDTLCRNQYRNAQAVARIEGTNPVAAYNWACVVYRQPTPIWTPAPPRPSPTRLGPLNPAPYCQGLGYRLALSTDQRDWACVSPNGSARITLGPAQYHILCRQAYNDPRAYALRDGTSPIPAYDWACFTFR
ncbi:MAG: hypothetical protein IT323_19390, partial [Anaerolineae bacterium]|nr:hypothetical protein [Anaerolineae bacterium]